MIISGVADRLVGLPKWKFIEKSRWPCPTTPSPRGAREGQPYLSFAEREEIAIMKAQDSGVREIARPSEPVILRRPRGSRVDACDALRQVGVPGGDRAVEGRAGGATAQGCQACRERPPPWLRAQRLAGATKDADGWPLPEV
jgi:hypothetical protein